MNEGTSMFDRQAHDEGYDAYWDGVDAADNPFDEETEAVARVSWESGWREARKHDYDESEG
jgi:ribosome modulation factor